MAINLSKVSYSYAPVKKEELCCYALDNVNLSIDTKGEFIAVVGHTGSGKSTMIQLLNVLLLPTKGTITIDNHLITNKKHENLKEIRKKIGLVFQFAENQLFEETVLKDIAFGPTNFKLDDPIQRAKEACSLVGLGEDFFDKSPFRLSGGEMRKVAIAGILASDPDVLILDEPTVGLDPITKKELLKLLNYIYSKDKTIIIVTHDMEVVTQMAKRVIVLDDKDIVYDGAMDTLFRNEELLKKHSLDEPDIVKKMKKLKEESGLNLDVYKYTVKDAYLEIRRALENE